MDNRKQVIDRLRKLNDKKAALENLPEQIQMLEMSFSAVRAARTDSTPVSGGTSHREDAMLNNIMRRDELMEDLEYTRREVEILERNIAALKPNEQRALELFYINGERRATERFMEEVGYSESQVNRIKNAAVDRLTRRLYGRIRA